jgi:hypothetical protein
MLAYIQMIQKAVRNFKMPISPEPVDLFQRLKKRIEARLMPYQILSTFVTMQATEMVNMALKNGFLRENVP